MNENDRIGWASIVGMISATTYIVLVGMSWGPLAVILLSVLGMEMWRRDKP